MSLAIDLRGKTALVTGGSRGIGAATVRALHSAGAKVLFCYRDATAKAGLLSDELGERVASRRCDIADPQMLPALIEDCLAIFGRIDVLVNNAAVFAENPFTQGDYAAWRDGWQRTFAVNLFAAANLTWLAMKHMRRSGGGRIINVASRAAHRGELTFADYGASKAALVNLTKSIARACAQDGIFAFCLAPGFIDTEMASSELQMRRREIEAEIPIGRVGTPQEVANIIAFVASPLADYANGATIDVNGASYVR
ncbi:MAG: SDR family oxidoreductase [Candidatus Eremiobacteraeota bacterium]|nr:SDR family oxidoreductase [Candidatus Eremiobacteraeota bacterium]MBC5826925.1 SDR family oxidoreductase [Candidatus Eremiobacteraeota bacterium]